MGYMGGRDYDNRFEKEKESGSDSEYRVSEACEPQASLAPSTSADRDNSQGRMYSLAAVREGIRQMRRD